MRRPCDALRRDRRLRDRPRRAAVPAADARAKTLAAGAGRRAQGVSSRPADGGAARAVVWVSGPVRGSGGTHAAGHPGTPRTPATPAAETRGSRGLSRQTRFVGRTKVMAAASAALAPHSGIPGVLLYGIPGAGKTACARELASTHQHVFTRLAWFTVPDREVNAALALTTFAHDLEEGSPACG